MCKMKKGQEVNFLPLFNSDYETKRTDAWVQLSVMLNCQL